MNKVVRTIKIASKLDAAVERLAKETRRTPSDVVANAIEQFLVDEEDLSIELERWAEYERTGESIDLEDVRKRLKAQVRAHHSKTARSKKK
jgi:predicted transcriptional regulator